MEMLIDKLCAVNVINFLSFKLWHSRNFALFSIRFQVFAIRSIKLEFLLNICGILIASNFHHFIIHRILFIEMKFDLVI